MDAHHVNRNVTGATRRLSDKAVFNEDDIPLRKVETWAQMRNFGPVTPEAGSLANSSLTTVISPLL